MTKSAELKKTGSTDKEIQSRSEKSVSAFDEMDRMFDNFFSRPWARWGLRPFQIDWPETESLTSAFQGRTPKVDVIDQDGEILVRAELPGVEKDDLDITLQDNAVTIRATTRHEKKEEKENYYHRELSRGEYLRTVPMPTEVDVDKAKANFKNGLLEMTLPKLKKTSRRSIKVD